MHSKECYSERTHFDRYIERFTRVYFVELRTRLIRYQHCCGDFLHAATQFAQLPIQTQYSNGKRS